MGIETTETRAFRRELLLTLEEFGVPLRSTDAAVRDSGVARQTYAKWCKTGGPIPHEDTLNRVLKARGVPYDRRTYMEGFRDNARNSRSKRGAPPSVFASFQQHAVVGIDPTDTFTPLLLKYRFAIDPSFGDALVLKALAAASLRAEWVAGKDISLADGLTRDLLEEFGNVREYPGELLRAAATIQLAALHHSRWELEKSDELFHQAVEIAPLETEEGKLLKAQALANWSPLRIDLGDVEGAVKLSNDGIAQLAKQSEPILWLWGLSLHNRSWTEMASGRLDAAQTDIVEARDVTLRGLREDHPDQGYRWLQMGHISLRQGYETAARNFFGKARTHMVRTLGPTSIQVWNIDLTLIELIERMDGRQAALARAEQILPALEAGYSAGPAHPKLRKIRETVTRLRDTS